jgi:hypothetical protein
MHLNAVTFDPLVRSRGSVWHHPSCWVRHRWYCRCVSALPLAVTNAIRHGPAHGQLLDLRHSWNFSCSVREIAAERLIFDRSDQQKPNPPQSYIPRQLSSTHLRHMGGGTGGSYWAICRLFYVQVLFFRHSGPRLYPLTISVGHQTSSMSSPGTYDAH